MPDVRIEGSFELLSQEEWDAYLGTHLFDKMSIDMSAFGVSNDGLPDLSRPRLAEMIQEHNNKVGSLVITYALCKHYFDKGIPDEPWYISPGNEGQSVQYMPLFTDEHWMRRYWFNYFSDTFYLKLSSVWDSVIEIINHFYCLDYKSDLRLRSDVLKWLKQNVTGVHIVFEKILADQRYIDAQMYRTLAAHGTSPSSVTNTIKSQKDVWTDVMATGADGKPILDVNGRITMKKVKAAAVVSMTVTIVSVTGQMVVLTAMVWVTRTTLLSVFSAGQSTMAAPQDVTVTIEVSNTVLMLSKLVTRVVVTWVV